MLLLALNSTLLFSGCASITRGTKEVLIVNSEPMNAKVRLSNGMSGTTPASFKLPHRSCVTVFIEKEGYKPATVQVDNQIATAGAVGMAGNIFLGGIIGAGVDAMSGATQELVPNPVYVVLEPLSYREKSVSRF